MGDKVLIIDDDPIALRMVAIHLRDAGIQTIAASTSAEALRAMPSDDVRAVVLDLMLPDVVGTSLLERLCADWPGIPVVMLTANGALDDAVECMRRGACDFVQKPYEIARLTASVRNALTQGVLRARVDTLSRELRGGQGFATILGRSPALRRAVELLRRASQSDVTVLIEGESGTGKEVAARAVHAESSRRDAPFVGVNCGAIPETLIESELFGHEKGAFTGAQAVRKGVFEQAEGGTIFLDEIGELRTDLQVRLLRVLQERVVTRVGGDAPRGVNVRVLVATNRDLRSEIAGGTFREDVYYRIAVFPVRLPALRERDGDVELLSTAFLERFAARHRRAIRGFTPDALAALVAWRWPGNVREMENTIERAVILEDGDLISLASLPDAVVCGGVDTGVPPRHSEPAAVGAPPPPSTADAPGDECVPLDEMERRAISRALESTGGNVQAAAVRLGVSRATIYRKAERYRLTLR
ncbi:MAG: sigma-54 dependent transcriptional regulator [Planctomycetes bacterium]|nr:sigma-54 dependent transcriptional regulator [Planctomycetota bacterium]